MKLYCIDSNTTLGGHKGLFLRLQKNNAPGSKHIFIVPDRYTLGVEKEICEECFPEGTFSVDTCSFTRLAVKGLGNAVKNCLSKEGTVLLLHRVIGENNDKLVYYKNIRSVGLARELFAAIASFRSGGITPEAIREKLPLFEGGTADKLQDLALLYEEYVKALSEKYFDTVTRVDLLKERIDQIPSIADSHIYVLGFNVYSDQQLSLIKKMLKTCPSVSVAFCKGMGGSNVFCYPSAQRNALIDWCKEEGVPVFFENREEALSEPFRTLQRDLFGFGKPRDVLTEEEKNGVRVFSGENPYEEVKCACREIRELVFSEGYRYKDIAVACNDEDYLPVLKTVFSRFSIPCFIDEKYSVSRSVAARFVFSVLRAVCSDYALSDVMECVRSPLSGIAFEEAVLFEDYCTTYNVSFARMLSPFVFGDCAQAEEIRRRVIKLFDKVPKSSENISHYCDYMISVLRSEEAERLREKSAEEGADPALIAYSGTEELLQVAGEIEKLCAGSDFSPAEFSELLASTLDGMTVSLLPQFLDCVFIGNTSDSRFSDVKALFVLGANEGNFPVQTADPIIISCMDGELMRRNGLPVYPIPAETNLFEKFAVIDLCSKPERLYVGYAKTGLTGEKKEKAEGVKEILERLFIKEKPLDDYYDFNEEEKLLYRLSCPENAYYEYVSGKIPEEYADAVRTYLMQKGYAVASKERNAVCRPIDGYRKKADGYALSVSMLENYFRCPYRHFLSNVLRLKEREEGVMQAREKGTLIHAVLENYFRRNAPFLSTADDIPRRMERTIEDVFSRPEYERFYSDTLSRYEMKQLKKECARILAALTNNVLHSRFVPTFFEVRFGTKETIKLSVGNENFYFTGVIDRADVCNGKVCIIDYKTGHADAKLEKVYYGEKIQLYVYLKHFLDMGYTPSGAFYLPLRSGYYSDASSYAMQGQMADDLATFFEMDDRAEEGVKKGRYDSPTVAFSVEEKKSGVKFSDRGGNRLSEEEFRYVVEYVFELIKQSISDIQSGYIDKNPIEGACEVCPYARMCGKTEERVYLGQVGKTTFYGGENGDTVE